MNSKQHRTATLSLILLFISTIIVAATFIRDLLGFQISTGDIGIFLRENRKILMLLFPCIAIPYQIWLIISIYRDKYKWYFVVLGIYMTMLYVLVHLIWPPVKNIGFP